MDISMSPSPLPLTSNASLYIGDALAVLASLPSTSVDAVVTDPPYAIKRIPPATFDRPAAPRPSCSEAACSERDACPDCVRADLISKFGSAPMLGQQSQNWHARETHSRGYADNDPGQFQRWCTLWLSECLRVLKPGAHLLAFGGTRTWHRLTVAAEDSGFEIRDSLAWLYSSGMPKSQNVERALSVADMVELSSKWSGSGTTLRPAHEPIVLARRPLEGTMVDNVATWGLGPLNLDALRTPGSPSSGRIDARWPSNVHLDAVTATQLSSTTGKDPRGAFWVSKPGRGERVVVDGVAHPTVKPLDLMRRLVHMTTVPDAVVLDPFAGSGTTLEACALEGRQCIGIERDAAYVPLIRERMARQSLGEVPVEPSVPQPLQLF